MSAPTPDREPQCDPFGRPLRGLSQGVVMVKLFSRAIVIVLLASLTVSAISIAPANARTAAAQSGTAGSGSGGGAGK
jgi:hypothetical protein